ncbi:MAG: glutamate--tRNA ligase [Rhodospirillaceae bacterium]|jgi:glutamyl-tRNA synthetase|nr:glutamate--tRNA ligase [Rhodospirillaceae bacterium]MBT5242629.1 glutamate--tRNA ligase [Rhodospirillaceae bacterium]MBT5562792.1 glutamate--tRNA ligase [Rhodospirillaceae bacterium]MBT6241221.1 glutamate--tRNA ligase [Rhodospirillaceae bacterium]MBT7137510.1 glutamate--tRNA ligase [Rhodospirillaceae bacterium]
MTIVRFAPSPTGNLHVGNVRMALANWLHARAKGGTFILRLDDTDTERSTAEFAASIENDLTWLGLQWDQLERQSTRMERYRETLVLLKQSGRVYACYETPEELDYKRKRLMGRGKPPIYDRSAIDLSDQQRQAYEAEGRQPHWRFKLDHTDINFDDLVRGAVHFHGQNLSDPVLVRGDGTYLYMLPSAVDDIDMAVTDVIRGEDHVANTAVQIQIFEALGAKPPVFAHTPLLTDIGGKGLSKRLGSMTVSSLREDGVEAMALNSYLAHIGTSDAIEPRASLADLAADFDISHTGRGTPKFDPDHLKTLNAALLHGTDFAAAELRLQALGLDQADPAFWEAVRPNLERFDDAALWHKVCFGAIDPVIEDSGFAQAAIDLLPDGGWDQTTWKDWTGAVKEATGRKGKELFLPLRLALTGLDHGPELKLLLPLIGRDRVLQRLKGESP